MYDRGPEIVVAAIHSMCEIDASRVRRVLGLQDITMNKDSLRSSPDRVFESPSARSRHQGMQRKVSEYGGYALLALSVIAMVYGVFLLLR